MKGIFIWKNEGHMGEAFPGPVFAPALEDGKDVYGTVYFRSPTAIEGHKKIMRESADTPEQKAIATALSDMIVPNISFCREGQSLCDAFPPFVLKTHIDDEEVFLYTDGYAIATFKTPELTDGIEANCVPFNSEMSDCEYESQLGDDAHMYYEIYRDRDEWPYGFYGEIADLLEAE